MKILIIRLSSLGDVVLTQSTAAALHDKYPTAEIHFITKKSYVPLVKAFGCIDAVHTWEDHKNFLELLKLRKIRFDIVVDLHNKFNTFLIKAVLAGNKTVTYKKQHLLRRSIIKKKTDKSINSTVDLYFSALQKLAINLPVKAPELIPISTEIKLIQDQKKDHSKLIGIFPGALHNTKRYPVEQFAEVICTASDNFKFIILGSVEEKEIAAELEKLADNSLSNFCGRFNLSELITVISKLDAVITNDSGPMHIAAALARPQIAIFGATHPKLGFAPLNKKAIVLTSDLACQPCSLHGSDSCPLGHFDCMKKLSSDRILQSLSKLLSS